jgi:hypothetical protein
LYVSSLGLGHGEYVATIALTVAAVRAAFAWGAFGSRPVKAIDSPTKLWEFEERMANVETIATYEEKIVEGRLRSLQS